jgi:hypothetical protein
VLGVLLRLVFIEQRHDLAHHHAHRIIAKVLRDGDQPHAVLGELADVELELELIAEEAREGMDDDDGEGWRFHQRRIDHRLERRPAVVGGGVARLNELGRDVPAFGDAIGDYLPPLIGNRQIALRLASRRDAQIEGGTSSANHRNRLITNKDSAGHDHIPSLSFGSENPVEHAGEMRLHDSQLRIGGGHDVGPVIRDQDGRRIGLMRFGSRPQRLHIVEEIVRRGG